MNYKAQYKMRSPFDSWKNASSFSNESAAIAEALRKKRKGALLVRVVDSKGRTIYSA
jgi:hypothetical protein